MAGLRAILTRWRRRFRPVSTPGPAATAVPADRSAELAAELRPTLALLEDAQAEARAVGERAAEEAVRIRREAGREAARIEAAAAEQVASARRQAAEQARTAAAAQAVELLARGEREAAEVRRRAEQRIPALADRAVADLLRDLAADGPPGTNEGRTRWAPDGLPG